LENLKVMVKVGGSLCSPQLLPPLTAAVKVLAKRCSLAIIPGGGPFANMVRTWDSRMQLSDHACHWMAVAAMNQYGLLLESQGMGMAVDDVDMLFSTGGDARILLPYRFLREVDNLPHTWGVTSDSIAAYLAGLFNADALILLKSLDGIPSKTEENGTILPTCSASQAVERGIVDRNFDRYLSKKTDCWIINGKYPERLVRTSFDFVGTRIYSE
jgi:aspartokinase-like uncharacterized kinase